MLNRIYIVVGLLAIIVLAGAFIAPHFIRWSDYRGRMEELATNMLGTPVTVRGEIDFTLLPQPRLRFSDVLVGSPEEPAATVDSVEAEFSLMDFLRDNYNVTSLILRQPVIDFTIDESGFFGSGVALAAGTGGVGLGQTTVVDATVRLMDRRSGETFEANSVSGELRLAGFSGPFSFQGNGNYRGEPYGLRFNSGLLDESGKALWTAHVSSEVIAPPRVSDNVVVAFSGDGRIYGLAKADGKTVWVDPHTNPPLTVRNAAGGVVSRGGLFIGTAGGRLLAIDAQSGAIAWDGTVATPKGATELERIADVTSLPYVDDREACAAFPAPGLEHLR